MRCQTCNNEIASGSACIYCAARESDIIDDEEVLEDVDQMAEEQAETSEHPVTTTPPESRKTTKPDQASAYRRTLVILALIFGALLVGFGAYWFLRDGQTGGAILREDIPDPLSESEAENSVTAIEPSEQTPYIATVSDTAVAEVLKENSTFAAYRDSLNSITDTLQGVFASYSCEPTCFAWFDVKNQGGKELRPFYCPFSTVSGYPLNRLPKDGSTWSIIIRETAIEMEAGEAKRGWPVVYELIELRRILNVARASEKPSPSGVYREYEVDEAPVFRASDPHAWAYLDTRKYPEAEKNLGIEGMVAVSFIVGHDGKVRQVEIEESSPYLRFNDEALRLVKAMPTWTAPGRRNGVPVNVRMVVRVDFGPQ